MNKVTDFDGPQTYSERLKVEYAPVVVALYRTMVGFAPGGSHGGVSDVADLLDKRSAVLRNQFGPTTYEHAPTLHGFLQMVDVLKSLETANEVARLADAVAIPVSPQVDAPDDDIEAVRQFIILSAQVMGPTVARMETQRLSSSDRAEARDAIFKVIAFASHLLTRFDPVLFADRPPSVIDIAPPPLVADDAQARRDGQSNPGRGPCKVGAHKGTESQVLGVGSGV